MGVDMGAMREGYEEQQHGGGDYLSFEKGETLLYIHPPCRDNDKHEPTRGKNFVPVTVHYSVGKANKMVVSLDPEANPIIAHPVVKTGLKKKKVRLTGKCPVAKALAGGKAFTDEEADESRAQTKYLWGVTPMGFRKKSSGKWAEHEKQGQPSVAMVGKQIFDGIMECFFDNGDISDSAAAIFVRVIKSGKGRQTKYTVKIDPDTSKAPKKLMKKIRAKIAKAMAEGGDTDLFRVVVNMVKSPDEVTAILKGVEVDDDADDHDDDIDDDDEDDVDDVDDDDDADDDDDEESDDDDDEESDDDDDEDDDIDEESDDEDDDEDDDEPADDEDDDEPADDDDDEDDDIDDDDEESDDDDDEEEEPPKSKKGKKGAAKKGAAKKKGKSKKKSDDDDEDDLKLDDLDEALADLEDDDDEDPAPKKGKAKKGAKKKATKAKGKKKSDDDEEPAPKKSKKGKATKKTATPKADKKASKTDKATKKGKKGKKGKK